MEQLEWSKLGLGLGSSDEAPPQFDVHGNPENQMSKVIKTDPLSSKRRSLQQDTDSRRINIASRL